MMTFNEYQLDEAKKSPSEGDLIITPKRHLSHITNKYGRISLIDKGIAHIKIGGPGTIEYSIDKLTSPKVFKTTDPLWADLSGMKIIWKIKE